MGVQIKREHLSKRKIWVDACRGIAILLVLLGHNDPPFIRQIYGFHMPLFFILSGYVYKDKHTDISLKEEVLRLTKGYLIPYVIFGILNLILHIVHLRLVVPDMPVTNEMIVGYIKGLLLVDVDEMPCCYPMWFLPAFAITMFVFYFIRNLPRRDLRAFIFVLVAIVMILVCGRKLPFDIQASIPGVLFVEIGYLLEHISFIDKHILSKPRSEKKGLYELKLVGIIAVMLMVAFLCIRYNPVDPRVDMSYGNYGNFFMFFVGGVFASIVLMLLVILIGSIQSKILRPFAFLGTHTVFFMAFDASTNSWGGTILTKIMGNSFSPPWYEAYATRLVLMAGYLIIWLILLKLIPPLKKITHS